jgi:hypothetical protein
VITGCGGTGGFGGTGGGTGGAGGSCAAVPAAVPCPELSAPACDIGISEVGMLVGDTDTGAVGMPAVLRPPVWRS